MNLTLPFTITKCSWPRPVSQAGHSWASEPEWDAPVMPQTPKPRWQLLENELCWTLDWRESWRSGIRAWDPHMAGGEMRGFHIVFSARVTDDGMLVFWDDDGSVVRRNGAIIHDDRSAHALQRHELKVEEGDLLEVAHWQLDGAWLWGARLTHSPSATPDDSLDVLRYYLGLVQDRLRVSQGPPLKFYTDGRAPLRAVLAVYSLVLNGYAPSGVFLFGEDQWSPRVRSIFSQLLPFADVVPTHEVLAKVSGLGTQRLAALARHHWYVMKTCIGLLMPPMESCLMDDDVLILDQLDDALDAFATRDLVYAPDQDLGAGYLATWSRRMRMPRPLPTARFNAGLYWARPVADAAWLARQMLDTAPTPHAPCLWEQGFIAAVYASHRTLELSKQRFFFPLFDGMPGGMAGYDYANNPCGFASVHFGGLTEKPGDDAALHLAAAVLSQPKYAGECPGNPAVPLVLVAV